MFFINCEHGHSASDYPVSDTRGEQPRGIRVIYTTVPMLVKEGTERLSACAYVERDLSSARFRLSAMSFFVKMASIRSKHRADDGQNLSNKQVGLALPPLGVENTSEEATRSLRIAGLQRRAIPAQDSR
jgi:hypothetical protein